MQLKTSSGTASAVVRYSAIADSD